MRGQFEAMGLAMIVILVSLGMFLFILFSFGDESDAPKRYEGQQLAQNTVSALLKTSIPDCQLQYDDLIEDVALHMRDPCFENSSSLINRTTVAILNATLDRRQIPYNYTIRELRRGGTEYYSVGTCNPDRTNVDAPGRMVLRLPPTTKTVEALLWLC